MEEDYWDREYGCSVGICCEQLHSELLTNVDNEIMNRLLAELRKHKHDEKKYDFWKNK